MRDQIFPIFFGVWVVLGIAGFLLFYVSKNVAFKRRYFAWFTALAGFLFLAFAAAMGAPVFMLAFMTPLVALITYLNIRGTQFCGACGRTLIQQMPFSRARFCSKCGAALSEKRQRGM